MKFLFFTFFSFLFLSTSLANSSLPGLATAYYSRLMQIRGLMEQNNFWNESVPATCYS